MKFVGIGFVSLLFCLLFSFVFNIYEHTKLTTDYLGIYASETGEGSYSAGEACSINAGMERNPEEMYQDFIMCVFHHQEWQEMMTLEEGRPNATHIVMID